MSKQVALLFEQELTRRAVDFRRDAGSDRYVIHNRGLDLFVSLDNLGKDYARDGDPSHIAHFVEAVLASNSEPRSWEAAQSSILFSLEPNDYAEPPELRIPVSARVDRVPVHIHPVSGLISFVTASMLRDWQVSGEVMERVAAQNLADALRRATLEVKPAGDVQVGFLQTALPLKASMILAPNLRDIAAPVLGWPLHAVIPARDFLYLWAARHSDFIGRVGKVVVDEFTSSAYPITTEVFEISDDGIAAIGAFPVEAAPD